jgi:hypothetical protein
MVPDAKHTLAVPVVPPANGPKARPKSQRTIAAPIVPPVSPRPPQKARTQSRQATVAAPVVSVHRPSQQNTMAVPTVAAAAPQPMAGPDYQRVDKTVIATDASESVIDVAFESSDLLESGFISPPPRHRRSTPTFEGLSVVAGPSRDWLYAASVAALLLVLLLVMV